MNTQAQTIDRLAKLLATENIDIIRSNVSTAAFDIINRVLVLPRWKDMTEEIEEMLMLHEVGHALFTVRDTYSAVFKEKKYLAQYANIVEDVRIERKMKERYPGSRKSFNAGYRQLNERNFFGVNDRDLSTMLLIDRINIYYKVGFNSGVKFTQDEYQFVRRADQCDTVEDVLKLAEEIYQYSKANSKTEELKEIADRLKKEMQEEGFDDGNYYDDYEDTEDNDASDGEDEDDLDGEYEQISINQLPTIVEPNLEPETTHIFDKKLEELADEDLVINYFNPVFNIVYSGSNIIPYNKVLAELGHEVHNSYEHVLKFKSSTAPMVSYLIKEFEMKKSAESYKRAKVAKLGMLDSKKLYAYKLKDDLFRQITRVDDGKKHGMIFLLDWSGSMGSCLEETIEQVINLAMFCQRAQIPYQVFAFTSSYKQASDDFDEGTCNENGIGNSKFFHLLEFFSHKMTSVEFNKMITCLLCHPWTRNNYGLGGTPLNEALLYMTEYVGKFIKDNQVQKMSFITLTDGEGGTLTASKYLHNGMTYDNRYRRVNMKSILKDPMTKKEYELSNESGKQTATLLNVIRDRWNTKNIGFYLLRAHYRSISDFLKENMCYSNQEEKAILTEEIVQSMRRNKYAVMNNIPGRDEFYFLPNNVKIDDTGLENVDNSMSAGAISRQLGKMFNTKRTSRVVLSKFIDQVS